MQRFLYSFSTFYYFCYAIQVQDMMRILDADLDFSGYFSDISGEYSDFSLSSKDPDMRLSFDFSGPSTHLSFGFSEPNTHLSLEFSDPNTHLSLGFSDPITHLSFVYCEPNTHLSLEFSDPNTHLSLGFSDPSFVFCEPNTHLSFGFSEPNTHLSFGFSEPNTHLSFGFSDPNTHLSLGFTDSGQNSLDFSDSGQHLSSDFTQLVFSSPVSSDFTHPVYSSPMTMDLSHETDTPTVAPSSSESSLPTAAPTSNPTTSAPTRVGDTVAPSRSPTPAPSLAPTLSLVNQWNPTIEAFLSTLPSVGVSTSLYVGIYDGNQEIDVRGNCAAFTAFAGDDMYSKLIALTPIKLTFSSTASPDDNIASNVYTCIGDRSTSNDPLDQIIEKFSDLSAADGTDKISSITCNSQVVKVGTCASGNPAICVGCSNPCANDRVHTLGCSSAATTTRMNLMKVDFSPVAVPANITTVAAVPRNQRSLSVHVDFSVAEGFFACNAYPTSAVYEPPSSTRLALGQSLHTITGLHVVYNISNLRPSTSYDVYCASFSTLNTPMSAASMKATKTVAVTSCCRQILITLAQTSFSDNTDFGKALSISVGVLPSTDVTVTLTATFKATKSGSYAASRNPFIPTARTFTLSSQSTTAFVAYNSTAARVGYYYISAALSGTVADKYDVTYPTGREFLVKLSTVQPPPPVPSGAVFASNGASVRVTFDSATGRGGVLNVLPNCHNFFTVAGLTDTTRCVWADDFSIDIFASGSGGPVVGGTIAVKDNKLKAKCTIPASNGGCTSWNYTAAAAVAIAAPAQPLLPNVVIAGPAQVGSCDNIDLDLTRSSGSGGRPWSSISFTVTSSAPNKANVQTYLNGLTYQNKAIRVANSLLDQRNAYSVSVRMCNFLGACGQSVLSFIVSSSTNVPVVSINADPQITVNRFNKLSISGQAYTTVCGAGTSNSHLSYKWEVYKAGVLQPALVSTSKDRQEFLLAPYSLTVGETYSVMLTAMHGVSGKYSSVSVDVAVAQGDIVAKVDKSSSFGVRVTDSVVLSAASSYDKDQTGVTGSAAGLTFSMACVQTFPFFSEDCGLTVSGSSGTFTISVPGASPSFENSKHLLTVYASHAASERVSEVSVELTILPSLAAVVTLTKSGSGARFNPSSKLAIRADIAFLSAGQALWTVDDTALALEDMSSSVISKSLPSPSSGSFTLQTSLILPAYSLQEMSEYTFSLTVTLANGLTTTASMLIVTNSPPTQGVMSVSPTNGTEYETSFEFIVSSFEDDDLPLSYEFSIAGNANFAVLRERKTVSFIDTLLPKGPDTLDFTFETRVQVYDILDGKTSAYGSVTVVAAAAVNNTLLVGAMESSLTGGSTSDITAAASVVSQILNYAECVDAPDCASLNRGSCSKVDNTCGPCVAGFAGRGRYSNTQCLATGGASVSSVTRSFSSVATACSSDSDCNENEYEVCSSGTCATETLKCPADCSDSGECLYINKYRSPDDDDYYFDSCTVFDGACVAKCNCNSGKAGSSCQYTTETFTAAQELRHLVVQAYDTLVDTQTPAQDVVIAWINGIVDVASFPEDLSISTKQLIVDVAQKIIDIARDLGLAYEDIAELQIALDLTLEAISSGSRRRRLDVSDDIIALFNAFAQYIIDDMLPGQLAIEIATDLYRITANTYDGLSSVVLSLPQSGAEVVAGASSQTITLPEDPGSYKVLLYELVDLIHAAGASKFLQSVPLTILLDRSLCDVATSDIDACSFNITFVNYEFGKHVTWAPSYYNECFEGVSESFTYSCPVGVNATATCDGIFEGAMFTGCPTREKASVCASLGSFDTECRVISYTEETTVCKCGLAGTSDSLEMTVASAASQNVVDGNVHRYHSQGVPADNATKSYAVVICTIVTIVVTLLLVLISFCPGSPKGIKTQPGHPNQLQVEDAVPHIYRQKGTFEHLWHEVATHHRWLSLVFNDEPVLRKDYHLFSLLTNVLIFLFIQSIVYNLADPNERNCKSNDRTDCESDSSFLALGEPKCRWDGTSNYCVFNEPDSSILRVVFCAVFVAILTVPGSVMANYLISCILCASNSEGGTMSSAPADNGFAGAAPSFEKYQMRISSETVDTEYDKCVGAIRAYGNALDSNKREFEGAWNAGPRLKEDLHTSLDAAANELRYMSTLTTANSRKRVLFLFVKDFLFGPALQIVDAKDKRDNPQRLSASSMATIITWMFLVGANIGMFAYIIIFGTNQSTERQRAWVYSFFTYLIMDIFLFSMANVLWTHVFVPSCASAHVAATKNTAVREMQVTPGSTRNMSPDTPNYFNAASYFFTSHRIVSTLGSVEEQNVILSFRTVWPKSAFVAQGVVPDVPSSCGNFLVIVGAAVSSLHPVVHDTVFGFLFTTFFGFAVLAHIPLYEADPVMAFVPLIVTVGIVGLLVLYLLFSPAPIDRIVIAVKVAPQASACEVVPQRDQVTDAPPPSAEIAVVAPPREVETGVLLGQD